MFKFNAKRICWIAMLAALSFLLNMVQIRLPANLRVTFDWWGPCSLDRWKLRWRR